MDFRPMSPDEIERTVQFLLSQQAQFAADLATSQARWDATFEKLSVKTDRIADGLVGLVGIVGQLAAAQQRTEEQQQRTEEQRQRTEEQLRELGESHRSVESNLNALIQMFERHLRENRDGPSS